MESKCSETVSEKWIPYQGKGKVFLPLTIADQKGEYACYAGMWWTPENKLAYMEPLCTIPEYRHRGLASAALSELYRRTKVLEATHMTGGGAGFYKAIGYKPAVKWTYWIKEMGEGFIL